LRMRMRARSSSSSARSGVQRSTCRCPHRMICLGSGFIYIYKLQARPLAPGAWRQRQRPQNSTSAPGDAIWAFGVHIDVITSMANLEVFFLPPRYPRPPGAPPW
jgi:hypothetical protein